MKKQLYFLQVCRGFAALLVVFFHGKIIINRELHQDSLLNIFSFGWAGVDFFFVLSGFIIFYIHQADIGKVNKFRPFITKRFLRIYLMYWIVLFFKVVISNSYQYSFAELFKAILLIPQANDILEDNFLGVSWTLSYEMFFYLCFAALILNRWLSVALGCILLYFYLDLPTCP